ncbi:MAG: hypothetical protein ACRC14_02620 [Paracoccaceae bacterium]
MTPETADFIRRFRYRRSGFPGAFRDIRKSAEGQCQDFAWTVLILEIGGKLQALKALLTGRAMIWRAKSPVNGLIPRHAVLWLRGAGYIDSTNREWRTSAAPHELWWPCGLPVILAVGFAATLRAYRASLKG